MVGLELFSSIMLLAMPTPIYYNNQLYTGTAVLVLCFLVILPIHAGHGLLCCSVQPRIRQCCGVTAWAAAN